MIIRFLEKGEEIIKKIKEEDENKYRNKTGFVVYDWG